MRYVKNLSSFIKELLICYERVNYNRIINIFENLLCRSYAKRKNINKDNLVYFIILYFLLILLIITLKERDYK